mmetsp:Transcript_73546/g.165263  ORF Transcript_73546/g.165263 Transcript_73546/m.165263 type:complete len:235 (-) Transcript_73546:75-779(-)
MPMPTRRKVSRPIPQSRLQCALRLPAICQEAPEDERLEERRDESPDEEAQRHPLSGGACRAGQESSKAVFTSTIPLHPAAPARTLRPEDESNPRRVHRSMCLLPRLIEACGHIELCQSLAPTNRKEGGQLHPSGETELIAQESLDFFSWEFTQQPGLHHDEAPSSWPGRRMGPDRQQTPCRSQCARRPSLIDPELGARHARPPAKASMLRRGAGGLCCLCGLLNGEAEHLATFK